MSSQAAPQNKFGFIECCPGPCPPDSDVGLAAYYLGAAIFVVVVVVSLVAGHKFRAKNWLLPLLAMMAVGAIFVQLSRSHIEMQMYHSHRTIRDIEQGPPISHPRPEAFIRDGERRIARHRQEIQEIPNRYNKIFVKGWLAYSIAPFLLALALAAFQTRKRKQGSVPTEDGESS